MDTHISLSYNTDRCAITICLECTRNEPLHPLSLFMSVAMVSSRPAGAPLILYSNHHKAISNISSTSEPLSLCPLEPTAPNQQTQPILEFSRILNLFSRCSFYLPVLNEIQVPPRTLTPWHSSKEWLFFSLILEVGWSSSLQFSAHSPTVLPKNIQTWIFCHQTVAPADPSLLVSVFSTSWFHKDVEFLVHCFSPSMNIWLSRSILLNCKISRPEF